MMSMKRENRSVVVPTWNSENWSSKSEWWKADKVRNVVGRRYACSVSKLGRKCKGISNVAFLNLAESVKALVIEFTAMPCFICLALCYSLLFVSVYWTSHLAQHHHTTQCIYALLSVDGGPLQCKRVLCFLGGNSAPNAVHRVVSEILLQWAAAVFSLPCSF